MLKPQLCLCLSLTGLYLVLPCSQRRKFLRMKRQKYGYIYRTHLFGNPTVRVTGADNVRQILLGEHRLVSVQWPASVRTILGSDTLSNVHGALHKTKKKVSQAFHLLLEILLLKLCRDLKRQDQDCKDDTAAESITIITL